MEKESRKWFKQALEDLDTAKYLAKVEKHKESSFFCQQAVEKALK